MRELSFANGTTRIEKPETDFHVPFGIRIHGPSSRAHNTSMSVHVLVRKGSIIGEVYPLASRSLLPATNYNKYGVISHIK
jgi:hypothetical protein